MSGCVAAVVMMEWMVVVVVVVVGGPGGVAATLLKSTWPSLSEPIVEVMAAKRALWKRRFKCTCGIVIDLCGDGIVIKACKAKVHQVARGATTPKPSDHSATASVPSRGCKAKVHQVARGAKTPKPSDHSASVPSRGCNKVHQVARGAKTPKPPLVERAAGEQREENQGGPGGDF